VRSGVAALLAAATVLALAAAAYAGLLHGTVTGLGSARLTLRADDGQTYHVDLTEVDRAVRAAVAIGDKVTVSGDVTRGRVAARYVELDSGDPTRGGHLGGVPGPDDPSWQRVQGVVTGISGTTLTLKADDGRTLTVDTARVDEKVRATLGKGERITAAGLRAADRSHFTARYILKDGAGEAASPRGERGPTPRK
jgi:hypothetical protein